MKQKLLCYLLLGFMLIGSAYAQERRVSGRVTAADTGVPLQGATVSVVGTSIKIETDANGTYTLSAPSSARSLLFTFVGYASLTKEIGSSNTVNAELQTAATDIGEVVVTGYGVQRRADITGSSARVTGAVVADRPIQSFSQGLSGQASGVNITVPNGLLNNPPVIRVRGLSSLSLSSFPLVVVDGIPIATGDVSGTAATNNPLADINPNDIETIDILKDAASAAIYGSRAASGVLLITTKRGKAGDARVSYDAWVGVNEAVRLPEVLNAQQYMDVKNAAAANARALNPNAIVANPFQPSYDANGNLVDMDWQSEVYRQALSHNHNLTISGGSDKTVYYFSAGLSNQEGFLKANSFGRKSGRFNVDHKVNNWLKLLGNINYTNSINKAPNSGSYAGGAFATSGLGRIAVAQIPNVPAFNPDGSYHVLNSAIGRGANLVPSQFPNPMVLIEEDKNISETNRLFANLGAQIDLAKGLIFRTSYTWDMRLTEDQVFWNPINGDGWSYNGRASNRNVRSENWNWINTLQYNTTVAEKHNLNVSLSSDAQTTRSDAWGAAKEDLIDPFFNQFQGTYNINVASGSGISEVAYLAYIAMASYNYDNRYFLSGNFRRDGNSGLARGNQWGNFGGASFGWSISEEGFYKNSALSETMNMMRFKASWGRVGNGGVGAYNEYSTYGSGIYGSAPLWAFNNSGNKDLKWETSQQTNIGVDLGFFNNRLSVEANWYKKNIDNMILAVPQAPSKGIPGNSILANVGSMHNKGWDFTVNAMIVDNDKFRWSSNLNVGFVKNMVDKLVEDQPLIASTAGLEMTSITTEGYPAASLYAVKTAGVNPENGRRIFINAAGEQVQYQHLGGANAWTYLDGRPTSSPSAAQVVLGGTLPTWFGGFNNTMNFGNFDAGLNFTFSGGNYIYNGSRAGMLDQRIWNNSVEVLNAWKNPGDKTNIPRTVYGDNVSNGSSFAIDANIEKGDFLRLQAATLGYRITPELLGSSSTSWKAIRVYVSSNNLFLWTKYTGVDPEISTNGNSNLASGVERNSIPQGRSFTFGVNVNF
jgi:TonB-linked SusC/RagA family outer membrane protein